MQFLTLGQIANHPYQKEYRYPIALPVFGFIATGAVCVGSAIGASRVWANGPVGVVLLGWVALWFVIFALILFKVLRDRMRPTNWLVRLQTSGILVKYRSYLNPRLPAEEPVVVSIPFSEIEWVRKNRMRQYIPGGTTGDDELRFHTYAELKIRNESNLKELEKHLAAERQVQGQYLKTWYGNRRRGISRHYPVYIAGDGVVRIEWRVRPKVSAFLADMKSYVPETPGIRSSLDYRNADKLTAKQQEEILLELLATGDRIGALRAARHLYGFDTTRAVEFLEELSPATPKKDD